MLRKGLWISILLREALRGWETPRYWTVRVSVAVCVMLDMVAVTVSV